MTPKQLCPLRKGKFYEIIFNVRVDILQRGCYNICYENGVLIDGESRQPRSGNIYFKVRSAVRIYDSENGVRFL